MMEKFTKPELLDFLCDGESGKYDDIVGNSPIVGDPEYDEF